jgi:hypothetical protein
LAHGRAFAAGRSLAIKPESAPGGGAAAARFLSRDHKHFAWRSDSHLHAGSADVGDYNLDFVADQDSLSFPARHHEHTAVSCGESTCWCE